MNVNEDAVIKALEAIEKHGEFVPKNDRSPANHLLQLQLEREVLVYYDEDFERQFLTSLGMERLARRHRKPATVLPFRRTARKTAPHAKRA